MTACWAPAAPATPGSTSSASRRRCSARLDLNRVSDDTYFVDLYSQVRQVSTGNLQRDGYLQYTGSLAGASYIAQARVQRFQTLQDPLAPIESPYHRVPQLNLGVTRNDIGGLLDASVPVEYVRFTHPTLIEGARASFSPVVWRRRWSRRAIS